jgi:hypothetical protein
MAWRGDSEGHRAAALKRFRGKAKKMSSFQLQRMASNLSMPISRLSFHNPESGKLKAMKAVNKIVRGEYQKRGKW